LLAAALPACAALPRPTLAARAEGREILLAVVTWNVHSGRGDLQRLITDLTHGALTGSPVREFIVLLQENVEGSAQDAISVARSRQLHAFFEEVRMSDQGPSGNAVISTRPILETRVVNLPRERRVRKAVVARIEVEGTPLLAVCAHLENRTSWFQGGLFSERARERQARALLDELPPGPALLGADLNTWLGIEEPAWEALRARFDDTPGPPFTPTFHDRLVLDHLFFDLPGRWEALRTVVPDRYGSDHNPVLAVIVPRRVGVSGSGTNDRES
jgi:endonuclease/exonuclease/phosphatase family metal-dependent hydrolase